MITPKTSLLAVTVLALALGGCRKGDTRTLGEQTRDATNTAVDKTREVATSVKNSVSAKLTEWKLTPADIQADLEKGGRIVRAKAAVAGEKIGTAADNARIVTLIKTKYVTDSDLSALKIDVDADSGLVTLKGTVTSPELIGRAIVLALDTQGVAQVVSLLTVEAK